MEEILQKAKKLFETEQQYLKIIESALSDEAEKIIELIIGAVSLLDVIKLALIEHDPDSLEIEDEKIRNTLKKVRDGERFESVEAYETLREYVKSKSTNNDTSELETSNFSENYWDDLFEIFDTRFDISSYFTNKLKVGQIITSSSIPSALRDKFSELREAYAYGLYKACIALCRMLLEISLVDCLKKIKEYKDALNLNKIAKDKANFEFNLFENIKIASSLNLLSKELIKKAEKIRLSGNKTIHSKELNSKEDYKNTFEIIKDTILIVETLCS